MATTGLHQYHPLLLQYLGALLQHLVFKAQESLLDFGIVQRKWQEMRERLLLPETLDEDLDSRDCGRDCSFVGTCDDCQEKEESYGGGNNSLTVVWSVLPILTNLSFHSWFGDVDGRLCVKLQASARLSLFPNDVSKQSMRLRNKTSCAFLKFTVVQNKHNCCWLTCREHLGHRWHSGIPYQSARWRWCHRLHLLRGLHSLDMKEKKTARRWFISFFLCVCFCVCCDLKQIHKQDWSYLVVPCKTNLLLLPPLHNVLP